MTVTAPPIFDLPWRRDARGYRVIRTLEQLRELARRRERSPRAAGAHPKTGRVTRRMTEDWPDHWPAAGEWIDYWIKSALRDVEDPATAPVEHPGRAPKTDAEKTIAASGKGETQPLVAGGGLIWPESDEGEQCYPLHDEQVLAERFLDKAGETPEDCSDVLDFTKAYGLLWEDGPLTVEDFRWLRNSLAAVATGSSDFREVLDRMGRQEYQDEAAAQAAEHSRYAPRFTMKLTPDPRPSYRGLAPQLVPDNLYSLIALQVTRTVYDPSVRWRQCKFCGGLFTAGTNGRRGAKAQYCSESHKAMHNDQKRAPKADATPEFAVAVYSDHLCPYCKTNRIKLTGRRAVEHCGASTCRKAHSREKARQARTESDQ